MRGQRGGPKRIALVEIRSSGGDDDVSVINPATGGWRNAVFGPIDTMNAVQFSSQVARNSRAVEFVRRVWQEDYDVTLDRFEFHIRNALPPSWQLTDMERQAILDHWPKKRSNEEAASKESTPNTPAAGCSPAESSSAATKLSPQEFNARSLGKLLEFCGVKP